MKLDGKVAIITGAGGGIGQAVARRFLAEGARCVLVDMRGGDEMSRFGSPETASALEVDITQKENIQATVKHAADRFGSVDILFNNAAIFDMGFFLDDSWDSYDKLFAVNVKAMFFLMQEAARRMVHQGNGGKIINMSSQAGRRGEPLLPHYCATKAAVISYTQSAALALAPYKINVNAIAPGVVDTPMWETVDRLYAKYENRPIGQKKRIVGEAVPLGRMAQPDDLTGAAVFLACKDADYVTAQTLNVDGGNWMN